MLANILEIGMSCTWVSGACTVRASGGGCPVVALFSVGVGSSLVVVTTVAVSSLTQDAALIF